MSADEAMLTDRLKSCTWSPQYRQNDVTSRGGASQTNEYGPPFWRMSCRYENLQDGPYRLLTGWLGRRNGSAVPFMGIWPSRRYPANHPDADNTGLVLSAYNASTGAITINKGNMAVGDLVSWVDSDGAQFAGEIISVDAVSGSSTTFRTFPFAHAPDASPSPRIVNAQARFRIIPGTVRLEDTYSGLHTVSFDARQEEGAI